MKQLITPVCFLLAFTSTVHAQPTSAEGIDLFERKIRPVLVNHCYQCHSADAEKNKKLRGGLYLDSRAGALKGGESGPAIVAGKPKESLLVKALHFGEELRMPPKGKLPADVIVDFERWIGMGAPDPRDGKEVVAKKGIDVEAGRAYWAFQPLKKTVIPPVKRTDWGRTPIDAFILSRLESKGITPNAFADREKLLRRVHFDLIGLPPAPAEVDAFLNDSSPDAYERLIDRLLTSPHHGERWARHWLDVARYAESGGYEFDGDRPGAYLYRDFVIKALNQDMPFDEFVRLQLAGDRLRPGDFDAATATGFLVAGPFPGQTTAKTRERIRYDHLDDMIATAGNALLGLSLGCARCHDHKYDPIPQQDYYRLIASLANTDSSRPKLDPNAEATRKAKAAFDLEHGKLVEALEQFKRKDWQPRFAKWIAEQVTVPTPAWLLLQPVKTTSKTTLRQRGDGLLLAEGKPVASDTYVIVAHTHHHNLTGLRLDALADASLPGKGPGLGKDGGFQVTEISVTSSPLAGKEKAIPVKLLPVAASFETKDHPLKGSVDGDKKTSWGVTGATGRDHSASFAFEKPLPGFARGTVLTITLKFEGVGSPLGKLRLAISTAAKTPALAEATELQNRHEIVQLVRRDRAGFSQSVRDAVAGWHRIFDPELDKHLASVEKHSLAEIKPKLIDGFVASDVGRPPVHFLVRGEVDKKTTMAVPGYIQVLMSSPEKDERWAKSVGDAKKKTVVEPRIALANWITDAEHGAGNLLARVIVNRLWQHHMGRGIVATANDFGSQGEAPTHPELLDYLASELIRNGWRLRPIHRMILLSSVYRLSNDSNPEAQKADPDNHLWWRHPPRRLEAEAIRDSLLAVSGTLDPALYGPSVGDENSARRSIYLTVKRSRPVPILALFDAPEAIQSIAVRPSTTVPTQALALMNSPLVRQRAEKLAAKIRPKTPDQLSLAVEQAYLAALTRRPSEKERERMTAFVTRQAESYSGNARAIDLALTDFCQVLLCSNEFVFVD